MLWERGQRTLVMGVLNATSDSFSGDGLAGDVAALTALGCAMVLDGADALDIGAASSRPGHTEVPLEVELRRATGAIDALRDKVEVPLSIDSTRAAVVDACLTAGARIVNDVSCLADETLAALAGRWDAWLVIAHGRREGPRGDDVVTEVQAALRDARDRARHAGADSERIIIDPGLGFAKTPAESFALLRDLDRLRRVAPVLIGPSRKGHLGAATGRAVTARTAATVAAVTAGVLAGADAVRVHDVAAAVDAVRVADSIRYGLGADLREVARVAYIGLGANIGPRQKTLCRAVAALARIGPVVGVSGLWETAPQLVTDQPEFLNAAAAVEVGDRRPTEIVRELKAIEEELGRDRGPRFGPRRIDLDLLLVAGARAVDVDGDIVVPHPRARERRFVLAPLAELAPDEVVAGTHASVRDLLAAVADQPARRIAGNDWWKTASP